VLVNLLGWRMTPPRGDNWAGCVGMVVGTWIYFQRHGLSGLTFVSLISGFIGGFGFASGQLLKLIGLSTGWQTNWHSILEQTYGLINGVGLAVALFWVAKRAPKLSEEPLVRKWTEPFAAGFVLLVVTYVNLVKNPEVWVNAKAVPAVMYGLAAETWFNLAWLALTGVFLALLAAHRRRPLPLLAARWLPRGQLLYLAFLWIMVMGNFERALVSFAPERLVTEGVIFLNAALCTVGIFLSAPATDREPPGTGFSWSRLVNKAAVIGLIAASLSVVADWAIARGIYGDRPAPNAGKHIRFGPNATATNEKPKPGVPHP
jgi:hypothetical protein